MPSRFPGVDPYLEGSGLWPDFHHEFITAWRAALRRALPKHYEARINEEVRDSWIEIYHRPDHSLIAVLELLSPTNKRGNRSQYLAKRRTILRQKAHLVELDLLIDGDPIGPPDEYPMGHYFALVARGDHTGECDVSAWSIRDRLPELPIPLKAPDLDAPIDLQSVFNHAFDQGDYTHSINYQEPPSVPLSETDLEWAARLASQAKC